jgi:methanogenic corrinoid protein MtbC1
VTISFDTSALGGYQGAASGSSQDLADDPCGEKIDWLRGFEGLPRAKDRPANASGTLLTKVIERDIIPRLFLAHRDPHRPLEPDQRFATPSLPLDCDDFAKLVLGNEPEKIMDQVQTLLDHGMALKRIYLDLLAPVARRLGEFWNEDRCTFTDVTIGLSRLHQVLREIGRRNGEGFRHSTAKHRVYLVPSPGEQHTFGLSMVEEFFLHAGWETASDHAATPAGIMHALSTQWIDVIGFTVGCEQYLDPALEMAKQVRRASANRNINILVGGRLFTDHPEIATKLVGVAAVSDGVHAVDVAENLLSQTGAVQQST